MQPNNNKLQSSKQTRSVCLDGVVVVQFASREQIYGSKQFLATFEMVKQGVRAFEENSTEKKYKLPHKMLKSWMKRERKKSAK